MAFQTRVLSTAEAGPLRAALSLASWPAPVLLSIEDTRLHEIMVLDLAGAHALLRGLDAFADGADSPAQPVALAMSGVLRGPYSSVVQLAQKGCSLNLDRGLARNAAGLLRRLLAEARQVPVGDLIAQRQDRGA